MSDPYVYVVFWGPRYSSRAFACAVRMEKAGLRAFQSSFGKPKGVGIRWLRVLVVFGNCNNPYSPFILSSP